MDDKQIYADRLRASLDRMSAGIEELEAAARAETPERKRQAQDKVIELRARQALLRDKLAALEASSDEAWLEYKAGVEAAADSLSFALRSMRTSL